MTFTVAAQDGQAYQWYLDRQDGQGPQPLAGATATSFSAQPLGADWSGYAYYCKVTNQLGSTMSPAFVLVVEGAAPAGAAPAGEASDGSSTSGDGVSGGDKATAAPEPSASPEPTATPEPTAAPKPTTTPEAETPTPEHDAVPASAPAEEGGGVSLVWIAVPVVLLVLFLIFLFRRTNREE